MLRISHLLCSAEAKQKCENFIRTRMRVDKVCFFYHLSTSFRLEGVAKLTRGYMERCFETVSRSGAFLEMTFENVAKILSSRELHTHSELPVLRAAVAWAKRNGGRKGAAEELMLKVRLHLLPIETLDDLSGDASPKLKLAIQKARIKRSCSSLEWTSWACPRRCSQERFKIIAVGGNRKRKKSQRSKEMSRVLEISASDFKRKTAAPPLTETRVSGVSLFMNGTIYVLGGSKSDGGPYRRSVAAYTPGEDAWRVVGRTPVVQNDLCVCAFQDRLYLFGGCSLGLNPLKTCFSYDPTKNEWSDVEQMNEARRSAACCVFAGKIVVSGGNKNKTAEYFDLETNTWTNMPSKMVDKRYGHASVSVKDKIYLIGGYPSSSNEVFDAHSNTFTLIQAFPWAEIKTYKTTEAVCIGKHIYAFMHRWDHADAMPVVYDMELNEWRRCDPGFTSHKYWLFSIVRVPVFDKFE